MSSGFIIFAPVYLDSFINNFYNLYNLYRYKLSCDRLTRFTMQTVYAIDPMDCLFWRDAEKRTRVGGYFFQNHFIYHPTGLLKYRSLLKNPWEKNRGGNTVHTESTEWNLIDNRAEEDF